MKEDVSTVGYYSYFVGNLNGFYIGICFYSISLRDFFVTRVDSC